MKNRIFLIFLYIFIILTMISAAAADGNQQSYPIPQLYPIGQVPNQPQNYPLAPVQPQNNNYQPPQQYFYPYQQQYQPYQPQQTPPQYYYSPDYYNNTQPYYVPNSGQYFYPVNGYQGPFPFEPSQPYGNDRNVIVGKNWKPNGTIDLTWTIQNTTREEWDRSNVDIKCINGCHLLTNPNKILNVSMDAIF